LNQFLDKNLGAKLGVWARELELYSIEVRALNITPARGGLVRLPARQRQCLTKIFSEYSEVDGANKVQNIKFRVVFGSANGPHADIELRAGSMKLGKGFDPVLVSQLLVKMGVWQPYMNA
jgi:hypothetical protein